MDKFRNVVFQLLIFAIVVNIAPVSYATNPTTEPARTFLEQQQRKKQFEQLIKQPAKIKVEKLKKPKTKKKAKCVTIEKIVFEQNQIIIAKSDKKHFIQKYQGKCISVNEINSLVTSVSNHFIDKGLITSRASLPKQNLKSGKLTLKIIEGKVQDIKLNKNIGKDTTKLKSAFPFMKGKILHLQDLEQGVDQINSVSSANAKMEMWPGDEIGTTKVILTNTPEDEFRVNIGTDNLGQFSTGQNRLRTTIERDNLIGINDSLSGSYITTSDTNAVAISTSIPFGYWTFGYDFSYSDYVSAIDQNNDITGNSVTNKLKAQKVISRNQSGKTILDASLSIRDSERFFNDIKLTPQPLTVIEIGATKTLRANNWIWSFDGHFVKGIDAFGALSDSKGAPKEFAQAQFNKIDFGLSLYKPLSFGMLRNSTRGQYSFDTLFGTEQISMGDGNTVRGFAESPVAGDTGLYSQNTIDFKLPQKISEIKLINNLINPYGFIDAGFAKPRADYEYKTIAGTGIGFNGTANNINWDISLGMPLYATSGITKSGYEAYINLGYKAF